MADKLMYIPNIDTQNYPYCRLQLVVETLNLLNQVHKLLSQRIRELYYNTLGTIVINSPLSPLSLWKKHLYN